MFNPQARFMWGEPIMVPYPDQSMVNSGGIPVPAQNTTAAAQVNGGDVVVVNGKALICHVPIPAGAAGSLSMGHGVYAIQKSTAAGSGCARFARIYWDPVNLVATTLSQNNVPLGRAMSAAADSDASVLVWVDENSGGA
jgi:predicted RecA/RadA family phage recombinase